jgi:hypothetical protein
MQLGAIDPIKPEDLDIKTKDSQDKAASELMQIKWLIVALLLVTLLKK